MICICGVRVTDQDATALITRPDHLVRLMVRAWHESEICHHFTSRERFDTAVRRNRKALESLDTVKSLFTPDNYLFSTKTKGRQETLYFEDRAAKQTGRLRQQHWKGPLAKIDGKPRIHAFLSKKRYKRLKHCRTPALDPRELCPAEGRRHIEFACTGRKVPPPHWSEGTVKTSRKSLGRRVFPPLAKNVRVGHPQCWWLQWKVGNLNILISNSVWRVPGSSCVRTCHRPYPSWTS
jgi:hypothetical protein